MNDWKLKYVSIPISLFFLAIFVFFAILAVFFIGISSSERKAEPELYNYHLLQWDTLNNETSIGFVSLYQRIEDDDFVSYQYSHNWFLISKLGGPLYECFGSCYCVNDQQQNENRRSLASVVLGKGLTYLLLSTSLLLAYEKSEEYFESQCREKYTSPIYDCPDHAIRSEVDGCDELKPAKTNIGNDDQRNMKRDVECKGPCVKNKSIRNKQAKEAQNELNCEELSSFGIISLNDHPDDTGVTTYISEAEQKFMREILDPYCRERSRYSYTVEKLDHKAKARKTEKNVNLCVGAVKKGFKGETVLNERVECWDVHN